MARIRSIKPEFWRDEKIATLKNKLAGYFFIGLWSVADDEGKFPLSPKSLSLELPIFRSKEVVTYLSELSQRGLIRESECSQWGLITNWFHQKIDKPKVPMVKASEIQWLESGHSTIARDTSSKTRRKDRIGSDRIGSDRIGSGFDGGKSPSLPSIGSRVWDAYAFSYSEKYGVTPSRNKLVNSQIAQLGQRLGEDAIDVARFYLKHNAAFYVRCQHTVGPMLKDAEALHTQWKRGRAVLGMEAKQVELIQSNHNAFQEAAEFLKSREVENG